MRCDNCGKKHDRIRFCSNTCKDKFHNRNNPRGYGIAAKADIEENEHHAEMDGAEDAGWDSHKVWL